MSYWVLFELGHVAIFSFQTFEHQECEGDPEGLIQNPLRPSLMLRQKPSKVFDGRVRPLPSAEVLAEPSGISLTT